MLEKLIIEKCAPTLANLKTGEIVNYRFENIKSCQKNVRLLNDKLELRGVNVEILQKREKSVLLYVYRKNRLAHDLSCPMARSLLKKQGYTGTDADKAIQMLRCRISASKFKNEFPHEIGLFLSYPVKDVKGFIENEGKNCRCCGYWKVYEEEEKALSMFAKFDKCKLVYKMMRSQGASINRLTVAC